MGWVGGLTLDFRPALPVVTHDQWCLGKMDCFGGMYCCLGGGSDRAPHNVNLPREYLNGASYLK